MSRTLVIAIAWMLVGQTAVPAAECRCEPNWQSLSVEVTEWGAKCEVICRPAFRLFGCLTECGTWQRPRQRNKLMRKTFVEPVSSLTYIARSTCDANPCSASAPGCDLPPSSDSAQLPQISAAPAGGSKAKIHWLIDGVADSAAEQVTMPVAAEPQY